MDHGITRAGAFAALKEDIEFYITVVNISHNHSLFNPMKTIRKSPDRKNSC